MALTAQQIETSHIIDDLQKDRARLRRAVADTILLLSDVPHALDNGRLGVVAEFTDRALTTLQGAVQ